MDRDITLKFSREEIELLSRVLVAQPYNQVVGIIDKINMQLAQRHAPASAPARLEPIAGDKIEKSQG